MKIGYYDAKRMIYGLKGRIYYIEENQEECYYLNQLLQNPESVMEKFMDWYHVREEKRAWIRCMTQIVFPGTALELKLEKDWNYQGLSGGHRKDLPCPQVQDLYGGRTAKLCDGKNCPDDTGGKRRTSGICTVF